MPADGDYFERMNASLAEIRGIVLQAVDDLRTNMRDMTHELQLLRRAQEDFRERVTKIEWRVGVLEGYRQAQEETEREHARSRSRLFTSALGWAVGIIATAADLWARLFRHGGAH